MLIFAVLLMLMAIYLLIVKNLEDKQATHKKNLLGRIWFLLWDVTLSCLCKSIFHIVLPNQREKKFVECIQIWIYRCEILTLTHRWILRLSQCGQEWWNSGEFDTGKNYDVCSCFVGRPTIFKVCWHVTICFELNNLLINIIFVWHVCG
jgi:hypothetical protein